MRVMVIKTHDAVFYLNEAGAVSVIAGGARISSTLPFKLVKKVFADYDGGKSHIAVSLGSAHFELSNAELFYSFKNFAYKGKVRSIGIAELPGLSDSPF